jgi:hypothetical protein
MSVFNRRNAAVGWVTWTVGKRVVKRKARNAVPSFDPESKRPNRSAVALLVAGAAGVLTFLRKRAGGGEPAT